MEDECLNYSRPTDNGQGYRRWLRKIDGRIFVTYMLEEDWQRRIVHADNRMEVARSSLYFDPNLEWHQLLPWEDDQTVAAQYSWVLPDEQTVEVKEADLVDEDATAALVAEVVGALCDALDAFTGGSF